MVELWTQEKQKKFKNALCGLPPDHKDWQEWYDEGNMQEVYNYWRNLADKEKVDNPNRHFWRVIMEVIDFKVKDALKNNSKGASHSLNKN